MERPTHVRVRHNRLDFIDDEARLGQIDVALAVPVFHQYVDERRVETLGGFRHAQWPQLVIVELALGVLDDGADTAEMLFQHHRALGEHHFEQVIDGALRRHLRPIGLHLVAEEAVHEAANLFLLEAHAFGGDLLVVADDEHLLRA